MYMLQVKNRDYLKISMILSVIWICGIIVSLYLYDEIVNRVIRWQWPIRRSTSRRLYLDIPFPLEFHAHIFDIQNPEEVQNGGKPQFIDVGPYVFHQYIHKYNTVDNDKNDTLTFTLKKTWIFKPELSRGLTGDEQITVLHPVMNAMALTVNVNRKPLLPMVSDAITIMFKPTTPFWSGRAMDLLFDGIPIDCSSNNFKVKTICSVFESGESPSIQVDSENKKLFKFSILGSLNDSFNGNFTVYRGKNEITDIGGIVEVDGEKKLETWNSDEENQFRGTDGYFLAPFRSIHEPIWAYERQLCISLNLQYDHQLYNRGVPLRHFRGNFDRISNNDAFCRDDGACPIPGTLDLFDCIGAPIVASLPHFLDADPSLLAHVQSGLHPKREDHEISVSIELKTGLPLLAKKRLQLNFELVAIPRVNVMKNLPNMIFPFVWVEEIIKLPNMYVAIMQFALLSTRRLFGIVRLLCFSVLPIVSITTLIIHFLIQYGQIDVIDESKTKNKSIESN